MPFQSLKPGILPVLVANILLSPAVTLAAVDGNYTALVRCEKSTAGGLPFDINLKNIVVANGKISTPAARITDWGFVGTLTDRSISLVGSAANKELTEKYEIVFESRVDSSRPFESAGFFTNNGERRRECTLKMAQSEALEAAALVAPRTSSVGTWAGSYQFKGATGEQTIGIELKIAEDVNNTISGSVQNYGPGTCNGAYVVAGRFNGKFFTMRSTRKGGRAGDCDISLTGELMDNKIIGTVWGTNKLELTKK